MKRFLSVLPILLTILILGLGAFMPGLTTQMLDRQLEKDLMQREDVDIALKLSTNLDFFRALDLFRHRQSQIELTEGYRMTAENVSATAQKIILSFGNVYTEPEVTPVLLTNKDSLHLSGVFWYCVWSDAAGGQEQLWLDDQSGQMVGFRGRIKVSTVYNGYPEVTTKDISDSLIYTMVDYCTSNYPVDGMEIANDGIKSAEATSDTVANVNLVTRDDYTIKLTRSNNGEEETYSITVRVQGNMINFNI